MPVGWAFGFHLECFALELLHCPWVQCPGVGRRSWGTGALGTLAVQSFGFIGGRGICWWPRVWTLSRSGKAALGTTRDTSSGGQWGPHWTLEKHMGQLGPPLGPMEGAQALPGWTPSVLRGRGRCGWPVLCLMTRCPQPCAGVSEGFVAQGGGSLPRGARWGTDRKLSQPPPCCRILARDRV